MSEATFDAAFAVVDRIGGWLTRAQAQALHRAVLDLPAGSTVVEVGSHQGRSTITLALARADVRVMAIDPFVDGWKFGGIATRAVFERNLLDAAVADRVTLLTRPSADVRRTWSSPVELVYIDGKHDAWSAAQDLRWRQFLPPHGRIFVHDAFSSIGVTLAVLWRVLPSRQLRYVGRVGSLAEFSRQRPRWRDRWALMAQLPWWVRNVGIKVLLRLRLRPLARLAGHADSWDPY